MHQVWRKRQGIPWNPEQPKGFASNAAHICTVGVIDNIPPAHPEALTEAFGWRAEPKLVRAIAGTQSDGPEKSVLRAKALASSLEMMTGAAHLTQLLAAGIVPALNKCCYPDEEPDPKLRSSAVGVIGRLARDGASRSAMLENDTLKALNHAATDEAPEVRGACLLVVAELARHHECMVPLVTEGMVKLLLDRCVSAPDGGPPTPTFQAMAVTALARVCQREEGLKEAIAQGGVLITVNMLEHEARDVRLNSAFCVASLTLEQDEKAVALKAGVMRKCAVMLHEQDAEMQTAAAAMLMSMCNGTRFPNGENACKPEAVKQGIVKALIPLIDPGIELLRAGQLNEATSALTTW